MEHPNYSRQMIKQYSAVLAKPDTNKDNQTSRLFLSHCIDLAQASQKFLLPEGGRLYDDKEYRALDENEPLRLPYPCIALEYSRYRHEKPEGDVPSSKAILFAYERDDYIYLVMIAWSDYTRLWVPFPEAAIPKVGFLNRSLKSPNGYTAIKIWHDKQIPTSDYSDEVGALLCFLNVLQCKNVHVERSEPKNFGKKIKAALPFDAYHILTIDAPSNSNGNVKKGSHRSPREHLRRGHIRRLADGRRIWVNATVVAAGQEAGKIRKDYAIHFS